MAKKNQTGGQSSRGFYKAIKTRRHSFQPTQVAELLALTNKDRVETLSEAISTYIVKNLPEAIERREGLAEYRTNPYVLLTSASVMQLVEADQFASFLFNNKLYMGLETSFGKSIETVLVLPYPVGSTSGSRWRSRPRKWKRAGTGEPRTRGEGPEADRLRVERDRQSVHRRQSSLHGQHQERPQLYQRHASQGYDRRDSPAVPNVDGSDKVALTLASRSLILSSA